MKIIEPSVKFIDKITPEEIMTKLESCARTCYQSEDKADPEKKTADKLIGNCIKSGHTSILEHVSLTAEIVTDRACYDKETKVLTNHGWKYFDDVDISNDLIYTSTDNGTLTFIKADELIKYQYNGKMHHFKSTKIDLLTTPNHKMWVFDEMKRSPNTKTWKFIEAQDIINKAYTFSNSSNGTTASNLTQLTIPSVNRARGFYESEFPGKTYNGIEVNWFLEFLGIWVTDGSLSFGNTDESGHRLSGNRICITQRKQHVRSRIFELLNLLNINYSTSKDDIRIHDQALFDWLVSEFIHGRDTRKTYYLTLPRWLFEMGRYNIDCFLRGVFLGDGWRHSVPKKHLHDFIDPDFIPNYGWCVVTASEAFANDLSEMAFLTGRSATITVRDPGDNVVFPNNHICDHCRKLYVISFSSKNTHWFNNNNMTHTIEDYNDYVYCLQLPKYHRLFVMRNGKSVWCGNCLAELTRHRIGCSYSVESTRYCNYGKMEMTFIRPIEYDERAKIEDYHNRLTYRSKMADRFLIWRDACESSTRAYNKLLADGATPQEARSVLNNSLKCTMKVTMNIRAWRHFLELRCAPNAHPHIKQIALPILFHLARLLPVLFSDIVYDQEFVHKYMWNLRDISIHMIDNDGPQLNRKITENSKVSDNSINKDKDKDAKCCMSSKKHDEIHKHIDEKFERINKYLSGEMSPNEFFSSMADKRQEIEETEKTMTKTMDDEKDDFKDKMTELLKALFGDDTNVCIVNDGEIDSFLEALADEEEE